MSEGDKKTVFSYGVVYLGLFGAFAVISPFMQLFLRNLDFSPSQIGLMLGSFEVAGIIGPMLLGRVGDRTGRYKILLFICMSAALALHGLLMVPMPFILSLGTIFFLGFFYKNNIPLTDTLASHGLPDFHRNYGIVRIVGSLGYVTTSAVLSAFHLIDPSSPSSILFWFTLLILFQLFTLLFVPRPPVDHEERAKSPSQPLELIFWLGIGVVFFNRLAMSAYYSFFFLFVKEVWQVEQIGMVSALASVSEIPILLSIGFLTKRFGYRRLFVLSLMGITLRMMINAFSPSLGVIIGGQLLHSLTFGLMHGGIMSFIQNNSDSSNRGTAMAIYMSIGAGLSGFIGSSLGGLVVEQWGYNRLFFIYGLIPLLGMIPLALLGRVEKRAGNPALNLKNT